MHPLFWGWITAAALGVVWLKAEPPDHPVACLAIGIGVWTPEVSGGIWPSSRRLRLLHERDPFQVQDRRGGRWYVAELEPLPGKDSPGARNPEYERAWIWSAPSPDSLVILRPSILSVGMEIRGTWFGDTLRGRAHAFSDYVDLDRPSPRANAFAVRCACGDDRDAAAASAVVDVIGARDAPDSALGAREDSVWKAKLISEIRH